MPFPFILADVFVVRYFHIVLVHHRVLQRGVQALVTEQVLHLFNGHAFVDGHRGQGAAEFVRVHTRQVQFLPQSSQADFNTADFETVVWRQQRHK